MPRSVEEYVRRWQEAVNTHTHDDIPYEAPITPESTLFFQSARSTPMGEGIWAMPDFGDAICFFRYVEIPQDLEPPKPLADDAQEELAATLPGLAMMQESWERRRPKLSDEGLQARKAQADKALDALLAEYVREGYKPDMPDRLRDVVNAAMTDWEVEEIWVLPGDLSALLKYTGNPLVNYDDEEDEEDEENEDVDQRADQETLEVNAPTFDLNNPDHRAALRERIDTLFL